ncbi:MAG: phosphate acyltransferase PlsX [Chitinophagaceae bacterium]|nr:phosphate acyltransferase PlsX [Chitinophagaceae bacterium]
MNIGFDMMGGDFAPEQAVKGLSIYLQQHPNVAAIVFCIGDAEKITPLLEAYQILDKVKVVNAPEVIGYHEHPTKAFKEKPNSSIAIGFKMLAQKEIDAFISAGNTGAMLVGSMFSIKAVEGVLRPTIATLIPKLNGKLGLLLDVGLNADCKPEQLNQFAQLGSIYASTILQIEDPKVALVNVGEEEGKGNILSQAAYGLLKENNSINFVGNIEGRDFFADKADVMVCDGFTGNIVLKMAEGFYEIAHIRGFAKDEYMSRFHYENYGGTPVLGVSKPVIIGHGISNDIAFKNMIDLAAKMIESDFCSIMTKQIVPSKS